MTKKPHPSKPPTQKHVKINQNARHSGQKGGAKKQNSRRLPLKTTDDRRHTPQNWHDAETARTTQNHPNIITTKNAKSTKKPPPKHPEKSPSQNRWKADE